MPPRPIHRWKTFWLGILVIASLAWAWRDSTRWYTRIAYRDYISSHAGSGLSLAYWNEKGKLPLRWFRHAIPSSVKHRSQPRLEAPGLVHFIGKPKQTGEDARTRAYNSMLKGEPTPAPRSPRSDHLAGIITEATPGSWVIFIPHWLLIASFLIPWLAFLLWRHRRTRHRLTKPIG